MNPASQPVRRRCRAAFTLIEMMVVVAIMAIMLGMAGAIFRPTTEATRAAISELQTVVESARLRAMSSGNQTALLIFNQPEDERFLRFVIVAERRPRDPTKPDEGYEWVPLDNGRFLPDGAYYWPLDAVAFTEPFAGEGELRFGNAFANVSRADWIGLIFTSQGLPVGRGSLSENPVLLVSKGEVSSEGLDVADSDKKQAQAFMIQRSNGRIVPVENPYDQLTL
jgi:prepilin-type N-terminal cleavage/methylation domain-containing protein